MDFFILELAIALIHQGFEYAFDGKYQYFAQRRGIRLLGLAAS
jgi:hypothetical protein